MRKVSLACAALTVAVFVVPSSAGAYDRAPQKIVEYSDLNLSRTQGAETLLNRIRSAARIVCGYGEMGIQPVSVVAASHKCFNTAMDAAVRDVDNRLVAEVYGKPLLLANRGEALAANGDTDFSKDNAIVAKDRTIVSNR